MPAKRQGLAGALINSVLHLSISLFLGFADITQTQTAAQGLRKSYKAVFWFEVGCAIVALVVMVLFVKIDAATSALTADERLEIQAEEAKRVGETPDANEENKEKVLEGGVLSS
jgi:hypothetical protein